MRFTPVRVRLAPKYLFWGVLPDHRQFPFVSARSGTSPTTPTLAVPTKDRLASGAADLVLEPVADTFQSFLLLCAPRVTSDLGFEQVLRSGFLQRLNAPEFGVSLLHPSYPDARSFPFWVEGGAAAAGRFVVRHPSLVSRFASPGRNRNVLLFNRALPKPSSLELEPPHDSKSHYLPGAPQEFGLDSGLLFADPQVGLQRRLYHECAPRAAGQTDRWLIEQSTTAGASGAGPARAADGWVNPVLLRIELEGSLFEEPPPNAADNDPRAVMRREVLPKFDILGVIPVLPKVCDAKLVAWELLISGVPAECRPNAVERLLLGGVNPELARQLPVVPKLAAFFGLDGLRGRFGVYAHGTPGRPGVAAPDLTLRYTWWPPQEAMAPNAAWFAAYCEKAWAQGLPLTETSPGIGESATAAPAVPATAAPAAPARVSARLRRRPSFSRGSTESHSRTAYHFCVGDERATLPLPEQHETPASRLSSMRQAWEPIALDDAALLASTPESAADDDYDDYDEEPRQPLSPTARWDEVRWVKSCLPLVRREPMVRDFFTRLFHDPRLAGHAIFSTVRRATRDPVQRGQHWVAESNFEQLQESVGRDYVAPASPVRFEIPIRLAARFEPSRATGPMRFFDLIQSLNDGGIGLLTGLLQPHRVETNRLNRSKLILDPSAGWWNDWHLCLFGDPAELELEFEASGLTLGVSILGEAPLGGAASAAAIPSVMSFTRPAPRGLM